MNCYWVFRPALPFVAPIRRHVIGPIIRRARPRLRHAAVWVCTSGAVLVPLPGPIPHAPVGTVAPAYTDLGTDMGMGFGGLGIGPLIGAGSASDRLPLPGVGDVMATLPERPVLDVPGVSVGAVVDVPLVAVPEPASVAMFALGLVSLGLIVRGLT